MSTLRSSRARLLSRTILVKRRSTWLRRSPNIVRDCVGRERLVLRQESAFEMAEPRARVINLGRDVAVVRHVLAGADTTLQQEAVAEPGVQHDVDAVPMRQLLPERVGILDDVANREH